MTGLVDRYRLVYGSKIMMDALPEVERHEIARLWRLAELSRANNEPAQSKRYFRILACFLPEVPDILVRLAVSCAALHRQSKSAIFYSRSYVLLPQEGELLRLSAEAFWLAGEQEQAWFQFFRLVKAHPTEPSVWQTKALFERSLGNGSGSAIALRRALQLAPDDWRLTSENGIVSLNVGDRGEAILWQRRAMRLAPSEALPRKALVDAVRGYMPVQRNSPLLRDLLALVKPGTPWPLSILRSLQGLICAEPAFRETEKLLAVEENSAGNRIEHIAGLLAETGLRRILGEAILPDHRVEGLLQRLRRMYLASWQLNGLTRLTPDALALLQELAAHCHLHEYSMEENSCEIESRAELTAAALSGETIEPLMLLACYCRIYPYWKDLPHFVELPEPFRFRHFQTPDREHASAQAITRLTEISPGISEAVGQQYEENPYPRWQYLPRGEPTGLWASLRELFPSRSHQFECRPSNPEILIAGCGTGQEACLLALQYPESNITAVDLSRASLGYARLRAAEAGCRNIRFAQADILKLGQLDARFDFIESVGVLHHMEDPSAGLAVLKSLLRPGGVMHLGLYSRAGRVAVNAARTLIEAWGMRADEAGIRAARARLLDLRESRKDLSGLFVSPDYYSLSGCRDLIFNVQETQYDVDGLRRLAISAGLELLGFALLPDRRTAFNNEFPDDPEAADWNNIDAFERQVPFAFSEMFRFWLIDVKTG